MRQFVAVAPAARTLDQTPPAGRDTRRRTFAGGRDATRLGCHKPRRRKVTRPDGGLQMPAYQALATRTAFLAVFEAPVHTTRKQGSCLEKEIMQGTLPGARRRGRPRTAWMDNIKTWTGLSVEESVRMTADRGKWRKYVQ